VKDIKYFLSFKDYSQFVDFGFNNELDFFDLNKIPAYPTYKRFRGNPQKNNLLNDLKKHEGFRADEYKDSKGIPTLGYGTKLPLSIYEINTFRVTLDENKKAHIDIENAEDLLNYRLNTMIIDIQKKKPIVNELSSERQNVIYNMCYQMGVEGVLKFKKMWLALEKGDYEEASKEMLDSKWAREDSPKRAKELAKKMYS
jgi:lysozyme